MRRAELVLAAALITVAPAAAQAEGAADPHAIKQLYNQHCAACHGGDRLGGQGPALLPENLGRLRKAQAAKVIAKGRPATQMAGFGETLSKAEIDGLVELIYSKLPETPRWGLAEIKASHEVKVDPDTLPDKPKFKADPLNLFVVVETGDHHVTILDGDRFEPIHRFPSRFALHGGPKFSPTGRFVYFASRDGWISKYDIYNLTLVAEIRAGINTRNLALSHDGRYVAVANYLPHTLVILDARDLSPLKVIPAADRTGKKSSRVSAVYQAAPRESFVVALKDLPELWEVSYAKTPPERFSGFVHSHEKGMTEALRSKDPFPILRVELKEPLDDFFFDQKYRHVFGSARDGKRAVVVGLHVRQPIAQVDLPGLPHLGSGISWTYQGRRVMATPHLGEGVISIIDMTNWTVIKRIKTLGPGFFLRSHGKSRYAWADVFFGPNRDAVHVIDKESLEIVKTLRPAPGKTAAHVEFTRDGRFALVSIWEMDGAVVVYDARTLEEVKRIPFRKPSGKYNVYNKITREEGTSH